MPGEAARLRPGERRQATHVEVCTEMPRDRGSIPRASTKTPQGSRLEGFSFRICSRTVVLAEPRPLGSGFFKPLGHRSLTVAAQLLLPFTERPNGLIATQPDSEAVAIKGEVPAPARRPISAAQLHCHLAVDERGVQSAVGLLDVHVTPRMDTAILA